MTILRSLLFVPGNARMLEKALGFRPDALVPDLEDSVPVAEKVSARRAVRAILPRLAETGVPVIPRVNALDTAWTEDDLAAVVGPSIYGVSVGKVNVPKDITVISDVLGALEKQEGVPQGRIRLIPWIETAKAIVHCYQICGASPRIVAVGFGAEDLTQDLGIERREDESEVAYPRSAVGVAARAAGVTALDTPYFRFRDEAGLHANCAASRQAGFKGKFAIHPAQIDIINEAFSPAAAEIDYARRVVAAFDEAERAGRGSTSLDGTVIDLPVVKRARSVLALAGAVERSREARDAR